MSSWLPNLFGSSSESNDKQPTPVQNTILDNDDLEQGLYLYMKDAVKYPLEYSPEKDKFYREIGDGILDYARKSTDQSAPLTQFIPTVEVQTVANGEESGQVVVNAEESIQVVANGEESVQITVPTSDAAAVEIEAKPGIWSSFTGALSSVVSTTYDVTGAMVDGVKSGAYYAYDAGSGAVNAVRSGFNYASDRVFGYQMLNKKQVIQEYQEQQEIAKKEEKANERQIAMRELIQDSKLREAESRFAMLDPNNLVVFGSQVVGAISFYLFVTRLYRISKQRNRSLANKEVIPGIAEQKPKMSFLTSLACRINRTTMDLRILFHNFQFIIPVTAGILACLAGSYFPVESYLQIIDSHALFYWIRQILATSVNFWPRALPCFLLALIPQGLTAAKSSTMMFMQTYDLVVVSVIALQTLRLFRSLKEFFSVTNFITEWDDSLRNIPQLGTVIQLFVGTMKTIGNVYEYLSTSIGKRGSNRSYWHLKEAFQKAEELLLKHAKEPLVRLLRVWKYITISLREKMKQLRWIGQILTIDRLLDLIDHIEYLIGNNVPIARRISTLHTAIFNYRTSKQSQVIKDDALFIEMQQAIQNYGFGVFGDDKTKDCFDLWYEFSRFCFSDKKSPIFDYIGGYEAIANAENRVTKNVLKKEEKEQDEKEERVQPQYKFALRRRYFTRSVSTIELINISLSIWRFWEYLGIG